MNHKIQLFKVLLLISTGPLSLCAVKNNIFPEVLRTQQDFVDKSEMLRILFDRNYTDQTSTNPYYYITTPRQFAKSINIDMVHTFAGKKFNQAGAPVNPLDTEAYQLFKNLKIAKYESIVSEHLAQYIVLQLDLMAIAFMDGTVEEVITDMNSLLSLELETHPQLKTTQNHSLLSPDYIDFLDKVKRKQLTLNELEYSIFNLIHILYLTYNNTKVILLVDEYDETTFNSYITPGSYVTGAFKAINEMFTYALTQGQPYLKFVLIQGITSLAYSLLDEPLRNTITHCPFLGTHPFVPFYGFTEPEVEELMAKHRLNVLEKQAVHRHYKGYLSADRRTTLYNPHSIINHLYEYKRHSSDEPFNTTSYAKQGDWVGRVGMFLKNPQFRDMMRELMQNGSIEYSLNKRYKPEAILMLEQLREAKFNSTCSPECVDIFITQSFEMGYLSHGSQEGTYVIPNDEMRDVFEEEFKRYNSTCG